VKGKTTKRRCRRVKRRWRNRSVKPKANVYGQYHLRASRRTARSGLRLEAVGDMQRTYEMGKLKLNR
jgi:hypothetical protein